MHKKLLMGLGTLALGLALAAPAAQAASHNGTQIAQADTGSAGGEQKAPKTKKKHHSKKHHTKKHKGDSGTTGEATQPK